MSLKEIEQIYQSFVCAHGLERKGLLAFVQQRIRPASVLYPGCFVHVTPSFYFQQVTYIDKNPRAKAFFADPALPEFVSGRRHYSPGPWLRFIELDYLSETFASEQRFDLLLSLYAPGIVIRFKSHLAKGGHLLVHDSFGQAAAAARDQDFEPMALLGPNKQGRIVELPFDPDRPAVELTDVPADQAWLFRKRV